MQLTKHEYIALEIFKHKNLTVDEAWAKAAEFLAKSDAPPDKKPVAQKASNSLPLTEMDLNTLYIHCTPQGLRKLAVGQVWHNCHNHFNVKVDQKVIDEKYRKPWGAYNLAAAIEPSDEPKVNQAFLENGWKWELMEEGESDQDCEKRVIKERERLGRLAVFQTTPFETQDKLSDIDLTVRTSNILKSLNINTYADLLSRSTDDLMKEQNFGQKCLAELTEVLSKHNLYLGMLKIPN